MANVPSPRPTLFILSVRSCTSVPVQSRDDPPQLHKEWRASHVEDCVLDSLPPYSPEPGPIERVWKLTRRQCLYNFPVLEEVVAGVETELEDWRNGNEPYAVYAQSVKALCLATRLRQSH
jgi:hypothetical protein